MREIGEKLVYIAIGAVGVLAVMALIARVLRAGPPRSAMTEGEE